MNEYTFNRLSKINKRVYELEKEIRKLEDEMQYITEEVETYNSEHELKSDEDYEKCENLERAADILGYVADELIDATTFIEIAQGIIND